MAIVVEASGAAAVPLSAVPLPPSRPPEFIWHRHDAEATQAGVPLPPLRPISFGMPVPEKAEPAAPVVPPPVVIPQERPETVSMCEALQVSGRAEIEPVAPVKDGACGIEHPVKLHAVRLDDRHLVRMNPAPTMRCDMATATVDWVRHDLAPKAVDAGSTLKAVTNLDSYDCRGRNGRIGGKLSEHAKGDALDVSALELADGRSVSVLKDSHTTLMRDVKASACERFATVLGPGSDGFHENHVHVDLAPRRHASRLCQWEEAPIQQSERHKL